MEGQPRRRRRPEPLKVLTDQTLQGGTLLLALSGWMDGGSVSTGTLKRLMEGRDVIEVARIEPDSFYIFQFPGSMEVASVFRPPVTYENGLITELEMPSNNFYCDPSTNLLFFIGQEPHLRWQCFADCVFTLAAEVGISRIIFMGSFGGTVPHTREPRLYGSASHRDLRARLTEYGVRPSDYEGPAGFSSVLLSQAPRHGIDMISLVAEIPGYLQGLNPLSIEAVTRRLAAILNQPVNIARLREASNEWEARVSEDVQKDSELAATVRKLEDRYDNELIGHPEGLGENDEDEGLEEAETDDEDADEDEDEEG